MMEAAETMIEALTPGQAVAGEHLGVDTIGIMTTEEVETALRTDMTDAIIDQELQSDYSWDDYRYDDRGPSPKTQTKSKASDHCKDSSASTCQSSQAASTFGGAKPAVTASIEGKEEERLQRDRRNCSVSWMSQS